MRVAILPTGLTEFYGLAPALKRLFPEHEFYALPTENQINSSDDKYPFPGFTSNPLTDDDVEKPPEHACLLVQRAALAARGGRRQPAADLVVIIDDLELNNKNHSEKVVEVMRSAVAAHLNGNNDQMGQILRDKVSFHLAVPMIEAWFFADKNALVNAGVTAEKQVHFASTTDPEAFCTNDAEYLLATAEVHCPKFARLSQKRQKKHRPKWLSKQHLRQHHPKGYLQWLCRDRDARNCTTYKEAKGIEEGTKGGVAALKDIDWSTISTRDPAHFAYLRALIEDLSHGLDCEPAIPLGSPHGSPPTALGASRPDGIIPLLRNI